MITPRNEMGVVVLLAQEASRAGIDIVDVQAAYPDMILERGGVRYRAEVEYRASNFIRHGHDPLGCDMIVCWVNDLDEYSLPILELSDPNWHAQEWELVHQKDKEIFRLKAEISRLQEIVHSGGSLTALPPSDLLDARRKKALHRQDALLKLLRDNFDGQPVDALNKTELGGQVGVTRQTIGNDLEALQASGRLLLNGHIDVRG